MKITRANISDPFTRIPNTTVRDEQLSWKARGLLAYLLSLPPGWNTDSESLADLGPDGRDAVRAGLRELVDARYLIRAKRRDERGRIHTDVTCFDVPQAPEPDEDGSEASPQVTPGAGSPAPVQPAPDNPAAGAPSVGGPGGKYLKNFKKNPPTPASGGASPLGPEEHHGQHPRCRACGTTTRAAAAARERQAAEHERTAAADRRAAARSERSTLTDATSPAARAALDQARAQLRSAANHPHPARRSPTTTREKAPR